MVRRALLLSLLLLLSATPTASAQGRGRLDVALPQFESEMKAVVRAAERAAVGVLVSRSEGYARLGAVPTAPDYAGRLGGFDAAALEKGADDAKKALVRRLDLARPDIVPEAHGCGVVLAADGRVLTPYHLVRDAVKVYVRLPGGRGSYADIHAADPRSDLAVLKMIDVPEVLTPLALGKAETLAKGQFVLSLANVWTPGFRDASPSLSWGLVGNVRTQPSANKQLLRTEDRSQPLWHWFGSLLQVDIGPNQNVAGAALVNLRGELVGLLGARAALVANDSVGGFAVPMNAGVRRIVAQLREGREVEYGFLGITFGDDPATAFIRAVTPGTPAADANLPAQQYIVRLDDTAIGTTDDLSLAISTSLAGTRVTVGVAAQPGGPPRNYTTTLGKLWVPAKFIAASRPPAPGGLRVDYATTLIRGGFGDHRGLARGVVVREVLPDSAADKAKVPVDRVIVEVNGRPVATPAEFYQEAARAGAALELRFVNNERLTLPLR